GLVFSQVYSGREDQLITFKAGERTNMVPDFAEAVVDGTLADWKTEFDLFSSKHGLQTAIEELDSNVKRSLHGKAAHAMEPDDGINAGVMLALFLSSHLTGDGQVFTGFIARNFHDDSRGRKLGLNFSDEVSGDTTFNAGVMRFGKAKGGT